MYLLYAMDNMLSTSISKCPFGGKTAGENILQQEQDDVLGTVGVRNTGPIHCKWTLGGCSEPSPHHNVQPKKESKILNNILEHIGNTPLVRADKIAKAYGLECDLLLKCEFFNAGGSVKDRIALRMFEEAELSGRIKPGDTIIEPTSGNTGIGLALCAAVKGYRCIICLPEKMSAEKVNTLKALGAEIVRTPNDAAFDSPESHIGVSVKLQREIPNAHILNQYENPYNPIAHYDTTAEEILDQCDGKVDMFVAGAGTGGTMTGIARKLKEKCPNVEVVGVDPVGSILAQPESLNEAGGMYQVEGIGYDFIPTSCDRSIVDRWIKSTDKPSFLMARQLIKEEGLLCGGSSGTAVAAAVEAAKNLKKGQKCVVILPDGLRNYMTKFLMDDWMVEKGFMEEKDTNSTMFEIYKNATVRDLQLPKPVTIIASATVNEAWSILKDQNYDNLPVKKNGKVIGLLTHGQLLSGLSRGKISKESCVDECLLHFDTSKSYKIITLDTKLNTLCDFFDKHHIALVNGEGCDASDIIGVITKFDLLQYHM